MFQIPIVNIWPPEAGGGCPCFLVCRKVCKVIWMLLDFWSIQSVWLVDRVLQLSHVNGMFISVSKLLYNFGCHCYGLILRCVQRVSLLWLLQTTSTSKPSLLTTVLVAQSWTMDSTLTLRNEIRQEYMFAVQTTVSPCHLFFRFLNSPCHVF
jgi:hypothetical protein